MTEFLTAKNGEKTCSVDGVFLHSRYNPSREAEAFAAARDCPFAPQAIFVLSPAMSYCAAALRRRFPNSRLVAFAFSHDFDEFRGMWDDYVVEESPSSCKDRIFFKFGAETLCLSHFCVWTNADRAYPKCVSAFVSQFAEAVRMAASAIATASFFSRRWLKNSLKFFSLAKLFAYPRKIDRPVLIAASGKSLEGSLCEIKSRRGEFFVISLSSATFPLRSAGIVPDLVFSTDGGFWAQFHLDTRFLVAEKIPVAAPCEASLPSSLLANAAVVPLDYGDDACLLYRRIGIDSVPALRCGTVSGTALEFALRLTSEKIFFCGLDLSCGSIAVSLPHARPNFLDERDGEGDFRLKSKSSRLACSSMKGGASLQIYASWFENLDSAKKSRIVRIKPDGEDLPARISGVAECEWREIPHFPNRAVGGNFDFRPTPPGCQEKLQDFARRCEDERRKALAGEPFDDKILRICDYRLFLQIKKRGAT